MTNAMVVPADESAAGRAESTQNSGEDEVAAAVVELVRENGGRDHGGGWWKRLGARTGVIILTIMLGVVGASMFQG